jgi:uncharacterized protein (UPF0333 family)
VRPGIKDNNIGIFRQKAQVILEAVLALTMLVLFILGAMAILKSANQ